MCYRWRLTRCAALFLGTSGVLIYSSMLKDAAGARVVRLVGSGLGPIPSKSGTSANMPTRFGNHRLTNALFVAAFASLQHAPSRTYYDRKRAQGGVAIAAEKFSSLTL